MPNTPISFATTPQPGPDGTLSVTITHLEMTRAPSGSAMRSPAAGLAILRVKTPTVPFYRFLYNHVGAPWLWYERRAMSDKTLAEVLSHEKNQVYVLYREGDPAGYVEFDYRDEREAVLGSPNRLAVQTCPADRQHLQSRPPQSDHRLPARGVSSLPPGTENNFRPAPIALLAFATG
ncbi:MAG: hypothetical protein EBU28_02980 [Gammaproteobacteria bacterium]|nr:hypothetical protein [Gammaproteobacteria bacterium]